jgi:beta-mannosidase
MDRDRNPKPAYYFLKRAYNANRIVLKRDGDAVNVMCANAAPTPCKFELTCGYVDFEGNYGKTETFTVDLPAYAPMTKIATISAKDIDLNKGVIYAKGNGNKAILRVTDFKNLQIPRKAKLTLSNAKKTEDGLTFTVSSDIFAHGVHFGVTADKVFSDQYFDLLPNESKEITIKNSDITVDDIKVDCIFVG